jgi:NAD(P)-dependent dehydrogenase (short-subunit alcohol dehydrogenase family)
VIPNELAFHLFAGIPGQGLIRRAFLLVLGPMNGDPAWSFAGAKPLGYNTSKAALSMLTFQLAYEFRDIPMKVNPQTRLHGGSSNNATRFSEMR